MHLFLVYALVLLNLGLAQKVLIGRASVIDGDTLEIQGVRVEYRKNPRVAPSTR
jgi:endonuclease YncB( thermonuclease family)